jgi:hypothetical protein
MKKLLRKAPLRILTAELAMVKGGTDPTNPDPNQPPVDPDCRAHIIDLG